MFVSDTWTPARRLAIVAGVRAAHLQRRRLRRRRRCSRASARRWPSTRARGWWRAASAGVVADPLYATHVDRTVGGETPVVTFQILGDGRRVEIARTTPTVAGVADGIRHPHVREVSAGADFRLAGSVQIGGTVFVRRFLDAIDTVVSRRALAGVDAPGPRWPRPSRSIAG